MPDIGEVCDDTVSSKLEYIGNASHTNISIKAIQNVEVVQLTAAPIPNPGSHPLWESDQALSFAETLPSSA
jgi:hypothetical protein